MKVRRYRNPFAYTAILLFVLFAILILLGIGMFYYVFAIPEPEGLSLASWPDTFTDDFSTWIVYENGQAGVKEFGIERLKEYGLWTQILDESGQELFSFRKPDGYPESYSMSELLALSESGYENGNTVFVSSCSVSGTTLNYIVGYPYSIGKTRLYYNGENVVRLAPLARRLLPVAALVTVLCGVAYSFWLSKKLSVMIASIRKISQHTYEPVKEKGVFGEVYRSLNKMDAELRRSERLQEETDRTRKEWISNITHDLKTPLSPIKGYAELLADGAVSDPGAVREYGSLLLKHADYTEQLVNDLKLTWQLESGTLPFHPQQTRLVRFLRELVIDIANDPSFSDRDIEFASSETEVSAAVDPGLFRRAVGNLVTNALVHNPPDTKVSVSVSVDEKRVICISVCDDGVGITAEEQKKLFTRYYRGTNTKEKPEGSGLGLAIARQIVTLHGGDLVVKSRPGEGTTFSILLPEN